MRKPIPTLPGFSAHELPIKPTSPGRTQKKTDKTSRQKDLAVTHLEVRVENRSYTAAGQIACRCGISGKLQKKSNIKTLTR
jgi:hypothetical protein